MQDANIKVSVILSVYNGENYIAECINSILSQTLKNFEFIIVDDASTDITKSILRAFAERDSRIRILRNEINRERAYSRNMAVRAAQSNIIAVIDADDVAALERLQRQLDFMAAHPDIAVLGSYYNYYGTNSVITLPCSDAEIRAYMLFNSGIAHPSLCFRKEFFYAVGGYDVTYPPAEDFDLLFRWAQNLDVRFANLPEPLLEYRVEEKRPRKEYEARMKKLADEVRRRYLAWCGFSLTEEDWHAHRMLSARQPAESMAEVLLCGRWLRRLLEQNRQLKRFSEPELEKVVSERWQWLCCRAASSVFRTAWHYAINPLSGAGVRRWGVAAGMVQRVAARRIKKYLGLKKFLQ